MKRLWGRGETLAPICKFGGDLSVELMLEFGSEGEEVIQAVKKKEEKFVYGQKYKCARTSVQVYIVSMGTTNHLSIWEHTAQEQGVAGNEII